MSDLYQPVRDFEALMAKFTGAPYAIALSSCSNALFLCCLHEKVDNIPEVEIPDFTYPSAPAAVIHAGGRVTFTDYVWQHVGWYRFENTKIIDSAKRIYRNMYDDMTGSLVCLSFHFRKSLPIGRGGMILTNDKKAANWFKVARHDGRHDVTSLHEDNLEMAGWNFTMSPWDASRGIAFTSNLKDENICAPDPYQDLSKYSFYTGANRDSN